MREGLLVAALGSAAGFALAYISIRFLSSRFVAQPQIDVVTLLVAPLVLGVVVLLACLIPARRAATIDPLAVLRRS